MKETGQASLSQMRLSVNPSYRVTRHHIAAAVVAVVGDAKNPRAPWLPDSLPPAMIVTVGLL